MNANFKYKLEPQSWHNNTQCSNILHTITKLSRKKTLRVRKLYYFLTKETEGFTLLAGNSTDYFIEPPVERFCFVFDKSY